MRDLNALRLEKDIVEACDEIVDTCSTKHCGEPVLKYCAHGCQFMCQKCYDNHQINTEFHSVISASDDELLINPKPPPSSPAGESRKLEQCRIRLDQLGKTTDIMIDHVKQAVGETKRQIQKVDTAINYTYGKVTSAYQKRQEKLVKDAGEELCGLIGTMHNFHNDNPIDRCEEMSKRLLEQAEKCLLRVKQAGDHLQTIALGILDSQMMTLTDLKTLRSFQIKLAERVYSYYYVTVALVTDSIERDMDQHIGQDLQCFKWGNLILNNIELEGICPVYVERATTPQKELSMQLLTTLRIPEVTAQGVLIRSMVVYKQHLYFVLGGTNDGVIVYCYTPDGSLYTVFRHEGRENGRPTGMCIMKDGNTAMLVVSASSHDALVWIKICDDFTMKHHQTQLLDYQPAGSYNDGGILVVCDPHKHKIHRYSKTLDDTLRMLVVNPTHSLKFTSSSGSICGEDIITLPDDVRPHRLTRRLDEYVIVDLNNSQVVMFDEHGHIRTRYTGEMHGKKLDGPFDVINDNDGDILITDPAGHRALLLTSGGNVMPILQHRHDLMHTLPKSRRTKHEAPDQYSMYMDTDEHKLYVFGINDVTRETGVFVYDYRLMFKCILNKLTLKIGV